MFIYTSCIGTFLFDQNMEIKESALFSDPLSANKKIRNQEWLPEELSLLEKTEGRTLFLGFKKEKPEKVSFTRDIKKLEEANRKLSAYSDKIQETIMKIAKTEVKESVKPDEIIIQASDSVQELDRSISLLSKRLREWYGLKNPELAYSAEDNARFVKELLEDKKESEMGAALNKEDIEEIRAAAAEVIRLSELREKQEAYVQKKMKQECKNIESIAGAAIGAKLLSNAGSLKNLAMMPATKLQILGAERSMFNYLKKKTKKMPRFGILHEHKLISSSQEKNKGKAARLLADKISIAARVDYFKGEFIGDKLMKEIEQKIKK